MNTNAHTTSQPLTLSIIPPSERLSTTLYRKGADAIIHLYGVLSYRTGHVLTNAIKDALAGADVEYIILDMAAMGHVSQEALDSLLLATGLTKSHGAKLILANTTDYLLHLYKIAYFGSGTLEPDVVENRDPIANKLYLANHP
jgi:anti-anti-sigma regulatory factor